ncbi:MAG: hypothetical protein WEB06_19110 [Actinomycetota bacterium]
MAWHAVVTGTQRTPEGSIGLLEASRSYRRDCRQAITDLESSLEAPVAKRTIDWRLKVIASLSALRGSFYDDVSFSEGPGGLLEDVMIRATHLAHDVEKLRIEQRKLVLALDAELGRAMLVTETPDVTRARLRALIQRLFRHRQHAADLVHDAYEVDIGGTD